VLCVIVSTLNLTLQAEAHSGDCEGLSLYHCRDGVSYVEVCGWLVMSGSIGGFCMLIL
jgi:hypothetical protein